MDDRPTDTTKLDDDELTMALVRSPHWQWLTGLVDAWGDVVLDACMPGDLIGVNAEKWPEGWVKTSELVSDGCSYAPGVEHEVTRPSDALGGGLDFDSPATRGCLLQMIRDAIGHDTSTVWEPLAVCSVWPWGSITVNGKQHTDESEGRLLARVLLSLSVTEETDHE